MKERPIIRALTIVGGLALLAATAIDTISVLGRATNLPLRGAIDLIQPAILLAGCCALVLASAVFAHARVSLIRDRMPAGIARELDRFAELMTFLFFLGALAGSAWLAADLWNAFERSEVLGIPWRWLRMCVNLSLLALVLMTALRVVRGPARP